MNTPVPNRQDGTALGACAHLMTADYADVHAQAGGLGLGGWEQEYLQLSPGAFSGQVRGLQLGGHFIFLETLNRALWQRGAAHEGRMAVGVPMALEGPAVLSGRASSKDHLHLFSGRDGFEYLSPSTHVMAGIDVQLDALLALADTEPVARALERLAERSQPCSVGPRRIAAMRDFVNGLFDAFAAAPQLLRNAAASEAMGRALLSNLLELLAPGDGEPTRLPRARRWQVMAAARERVEASIARPPTVAELALALGLPRRTLQQVFQDTLGMRPVEYLRAMRLNAARRQLQDGAASVTDVATALGFWHFGHFAHDYGALFGEKPVDTLRSAGRRR